MRIARRKSDGALFRIHLPEWYWEDQAKVDAFTLSVLWHFQGIERKSRWVWPWFTRYRVLQEPFLEWWWTSNPGAFEMEDL